MFSQYPLSSTTTNQTKLNELKAIPRSVRKSFGIKNILEITATIQE